MMSQQQYFGRSTEFEAERRRLSILERLFDSVTRDALTRLGVGEGWRCCEIGAGGGTITRWLAQAVGPIGRVVAVDLDTRFLTAIDQANVEVIKADILSDTSIGHSFDLVFTRFVLLHLRSSGGDPPHGRAGETERLGVRDRRRSLQSVRCRPGSPQCPTL
jgi:2-polyprenyl-3-methyl-5-hydroxy-6-metoxy-1,4-benzoquinol methylase